MKKVLSLILVLVLICSFAIGAAAKGSGDPHPPTHDCWIESGCEGGVCWMDKCCIDCVWNKGGYDCIGPICVSILP